jgi:hypothetical protein
MVCLRCGEWERGLTLKTEKAQKCADSPLVCTLHTVLDRLQGHGSGKATISLFSRGQVARSSDFPSSFRSATARPIGL